MKTKIMESFDFKIPPIGISFSDEKPEEAIEFSGNKRICLVPLFRSAANGNTIALTEETCTCAGGAVGLCRGDAFTRRNHRTCELLSTGMTSKSPNDLPKHLQHGERFFKSPEVVQRWKDSLPYVDDPAKYTIFKPLAGFAKDNPPAIVLFFVNPDQLSVLLIMSGYSRGSAFNVMAPFSAACQSILFAYNEIGKEEPKAIMGGFDIAQRHSLPKEILTLTMPYQLFEEIEDGIDEGCLTTAAWKKIKSRWT